MLRLRTAVTVHEQVISVDEENSPVFGVNFDDRIIYRDGVIDSGVTVNVSLSDATNAVYDVNWSAHTIGIHQLYLKNEVTDVIFISETYRVVTDEEAETTFYVGL